MTLSAICTNFLAARNINASESDHSRRLSIMIAYYFVIGSVSIKRLCSKTQKRQQATHVTTDETCFRI